MRLVCVHNTKYETLMKYQRIIEGMNVAAHISDGSIELEFQDGTVLHADSPKELERKLR